MKKMLIFIIIVIVILAIIYGINNIYTVNLRQAKRDKEFKAELDDMKNFEYKFEYRLEIRKNEKVSKTN